MDQGSPVSTVSLLSAAFNKIDDVNYKVTVLKGVSSAWRRAVSSRSAWAHLTTCSIYDGDYFCGFGSGSENDTLRQLKVNLRDLESKNIKFEPIGFVLSRCRHLRNLDLRVLRTDSIHVLLCNYSLPELNSIAYCALDYGMGCDSEVARLIDQCKHNLKTLTFNATLNQELSTAVLGCAHIEKLELRLSRSTYDVFEAFESPSLKRLSLGMQDRTLSVSSLSELCARLQNGVLQSLTELKVNCESVDEIRQVLFGLLNHKVMQNVHFFSLFLVDDSLEENVDTTMIADWVAALPKLAPEIVDFKLNFYSAINREDECFTAIEVRRVIQSWLSTVGDQKRLGGGGTDLSLKLDINHEVMKVVIDGLDSDSITISDICHAGKDGVVSFVMNDLNNTVKLKVYSTFRFRRLWE